MYVCMYVCNCMYTCMYVCMYVHIPRSHGSHSSTKASSHLARKSRLIGPGCILYLFLPTSKAPAHALFALSGQKGTSKSQKPRCLGRRPLFLSPGRPLCVRTHTHPRVRMYIRYRDSQTDRQTDTHAHTHAHTHTHLHNHTHTYPARGCSH